MKSTAEVERKLILDISNHDPERSERNLRRALRIVARLDQAVPLLQSRIKHLEMIEFKQEWHIKADELEEQRDDLAEELAELYPAFIEQITELYAAIDANIAAIDQLHRVAPTGEVAGSAMQSCGRVICRTTMLHIPSCERI